MQMKSGDNNVVLGQTSRAKLMSISFCRRVNPYAALFSPAADNPNSATRSTNTECAPGASAFNTSVPRQNSRPIITARFNTATLAGSTSPEASAIKLTSAMARDNDAVTAD